MEKVGISEDAKKTEHLMAEVAAYYVEYLAASLWCNCDRAGWARLIRSELICEYCGNEEPEYYKIYGTDNQACVHCNGEQ